MQIAIVKKRESFLKIELKWVNKKIDEPKREKRLLSAFLATQEGQRNNIRRAVPNIDFMRRRNTSFSKNIF